MRALSKLIGMMLLLLPAVVLSQSDERARQATAHKRVLVLYWYERNYPGNMRFDELFQTALRDAAKGPVEYYSEYLESNRFPGENQLVVLRDYLEEKYAQVPIDVVVTNTPAPLDFLTRYRDRLFSHTPIVFATIDFPKPELLRSGAGATGIVYAMSHRQSVALGLQLHPDTKQVFVISGTNEFEITARRELEELASRVKIEYLTGIRPEELMLRMKSLPEKSIILYVRQQFSDGRGRVLDPPDFLSFIVRSARAPIYVMADVHVGLGATGGYVWTVQNNATRLAELAVKVANGANVRNIPVEPTPVTPIFDWRQLQRWNISEDRLPPGSIIRFRDPSMWQQYKWQIVVAIVVFVLQAFLIGGLLIERRRARRSRGELENYKGHLEELVRDRTADLVEARDEALAANRSKSMFLAHMSHELRTPLNAILGFSAIVRRDADLSDEHRKDLAIVGNSGEHLLGLIDEVLDMAKIETGSTGVESVAADIHGLVNDTVNMLRERAEAKNLDLLVNIASRCPQFVRTDPAKLRQVITNLIGNAIKYTEQGTISVELDAASGAGSSEVMLLLDVKDTGIGIAPEDHARIFKPFVQVDRAATTKGTGLGLSITRHFTQLLGGTILVDSTPGHGSQFHVELPVQLAEASEVTAATAKVQQVIGLRPGQPEYRILIVEDQRENWMLLQHLLETSGFKVRVALDGLQAVEAFKAWRPHFIWMDVRLPGIDGLEATKRIRRLPGGSKVKIVAVTASAFASQRAEVIAAGCDDFLRKPYRYNEIFECMARYLGVEYLLRASSPPDGTIADTIGAEDLASLPAALRDEIESAVISLDRTRIALLVSKISEENGSLGHVLGHLADKLAYSRILQALQSCKTSLAGRSPADSASDKEPVSDASPTLYSESR